MAELKNIRIAVSGVYDYAKSEVTPMLHLPLPGMGAPAWVEDKKVYKVYRPATVLAACKEKFKMLPLTHHHPDVAVNGENFQKYTKGYTGETPWVDWIEGKDEVGIRSTVMLYDDEVLDAYKRGEIQLSPGYIAEFAWQKGTAPDGQEYDIVMKSIKDVNHLALLPAGRGGAEAVVLDRAPQQKSIFDLVKDARTCSIFDLVKNPLVKDSMTWSGHKLQGRRKWNGLDISIENRKGSVRKGTDKDGHEWAITMKHPYGYIRGTEGTDGDHLDCYLGEHEDAPQVFIIHQNDPLTGKYDEDKVMLGFRDWTEAKKAYMEQYDRPGFFGGMDTMTLDEFLDNIRDRRNKGKKISTACSA